MFRKYICISFNIAVLAITQLQSFKDFDCSTIYLCRDGEPFFTRASKGVHNFRGVQKTRVKNILRTPRWRVKYTILPLIMEVQYFLFTPLGRWGYF